MVSNTGTAISPQHVDLAPGEAEILIELLERERQYLPVEIHHSSTAKYREQLRRRLDVVEGILQRVRPA